MFKICRYANSQTEKRSIHIETTIYLYEIRFYQIENEYEL